VKEVAQDDDGGHSDDGRYEKKCEQGCVRCRKEYKMMMGALLTATKDANVISDCTESSKLTSCLQLGTFNLRRNSNEHINS
jgi:hypothetical protein